MIERDIVGVTDINGVDFKLALVGAELSEAPSPKQKSQQPRPQNHIETKTGLRGFLATEKLPNSESNQESEVLCSKP